MLYVVSHAMVEGAADPFVLEGLAVPSPVQEWQALELCASSPG